MVSARNRAARRHNRQVKIKAMGRYMAAVMPWASDKQVRIRARHPKCDCWMCKAGDRDERNRRIDQIINDKLRAELLPLYVCPPDLEGMLLRDGVWIGKYEPEDKEGVAHG